MSKRTWPELLDQLNGALLQDEEFTRSLPPGVESQGWLGRDGASETTIEELEQRIDARLPESYRSLLAVTDGWTTLGFLWGGLLPSLEVDWFRSLEPEWLKVWSDHPDEPTTTDAEHSVYGDEQDSVIFRTEYLRDCLQISAVYDGAVILLNPEVKTADGEWEAWMFANWYPGAVRYKSMPELMDSILEEALENAQGT